jgi:hypothetical protein
MKRIVWTFGLIAGAVMAAFMAVTVPFLGDHGGADWIVGYAGMVAAFLLVYFGVRSYRDNVLGGSISFGRAFGTGIDRARKSGKSEADVAKLRSDMDTMVRRVENPLFVTVETFGEPFPVGIVVALVTAGVLRRPRRDATPNNLTAEVT